MLVYETGKCVFARIIFLNLSVHTFPAIYSVHTTLKLELIKNKSNNFILCEITK